MIEQIVIRRAFHEWLSKHPAKWKIGTMTVNGKFHHYMDPDTDNAWMGFEAGYRKASEENERLYMVD